MDLPHVSCKELSGGNFSLEFRRAAKVYTTQLRTQCNCVHSAPAGYSAAIASSE
ncbi:MAG: hypothetical protein IPK82_16965 [Polyangiaceae bacterium]|nr:hypothetical protein [Polyangiaceae bacterium]